MRGRCLNGIESGLKHEVLPDRKMGGGGGFVSEARSQWAGGATRSESIGVGFKSLIVDPICEFLGAAGGRKKEQQFKESCGEEGLVAARRKRMGTCHLVHWCEDYILRLRSCLASA